MTISTIALALSGTWSDSYRVALGGYCELGPGAGRSRCVAFCGAEGELPRVALCNAYYVQISDQVRRPAEFKHIIKRRKRN